MDEGDLFESFAEITVFELYGLNKEDFPKDEFFLNSIPSRDDYNSLQILFSNVNSKELEVIILGESNAKESEITPQNQAIWNYLDQDGNIVGIIETERINRPSLIKSTIQKIELYGQPMTLYSTVELIYSTFRVALTLFDDSTGKAIAFKDLEGRYYVDEPEKTNSYGHHGPMWDIHKKLFLLQKNDVSAESHIYLTSSIPGFDLEIRQIAASDSFYVSPEYRGKGVGKLLWFTALEMSRLLGSQMHHVSHDESRKRGNGISYYSKFLDTTMTGSYHGWVFPLTAEAAIELSPAYSVKKT